MDNTLVFEEVLKDINSSFIFQSALNGRQAPDRLRETTNTIPGLIFPDLNMHLPSTGSAGNTYIPFSDNNHHPF